MAMSNAERQRRYRERAFKDPDGLLRNRVTLDLSVSSARALERLSRGYGVTKRELVERLLDEAQRAVLSRLDSDSQDAFYDGKLAAGVLALDDRPLSRNDEREPEPPEPEPERDWLLDLAEWVEPGPWKRATYWKQNIAKLGHIDDAAWLHSVLLRADDLERLGVLSEPLGQGGATLSGNMVVEEVMLWRELQ